MTIAEMLRRRHLLKSQLQYDIEAVDEALVRRFIIPPDCGKSPDLAREFFLGRPLQHERSLEHYLKMTRKQPAESCVVYLKRLPFKYHVKKKPLADSSEMDAESQAALDELWRQMQEPYDPSKETEDSKYTLC